VIKNNSFLFSAQTIFHLEIQLNIVNRTTDYFFVCCFF